MWDLLLNVGSRIQTHTRYAYVYRLKESSQEFWMKVRKKTRRGNDAKKVERWTKVSNEEERNSFRWR